jgi:hypothetical protein
MCQQRQQALQENRALFDVDVAVVEDLRQEAAELDGGAEVALGLPQCIEPVLACWWVPRLSSSASKAWQTWV